MQADRPTLRTLDASRKKIPDSAFVYQQKPRSSYSLNAVVEYDKVKTLSADMKKVRSAYRSAHVVPEVTTCSSRTFGAGDKRLPDSAFAYQQKPRSSYSLESVVEYDSVKTLSADMKKVRSAYRQYVTIT